MTTASVLVVVFTACALGLAAFALFASWGARRDARQALDAVRSLAARTPRRKPAPEPEHVERRDEDFGPPPGEPERRRHRAPEDAPRARRRDADDPQWSTGAPAGPEHLPTAEHPAPTTQFRTPPPPLPRPGAIGRPQ